RSGPPSSDRSREWCACWRCLRRFRPCVGKLQLTIGVVHLAWRYELIKFKCEFTCPVSARRRRRACKAVRAGSRPDRPPQCQGGLSFMLTVSRITHIAIKVTDIEATLGFYVGQLGFEEMFRLDRDGKLWIVYLRISDTQYLEIFPGGEGVGVPGP